MRYLSFSSIPKQEFHISVPDDLVPLFREHARKNGVKPNELMTYVLCEIIGRDPREYGLHPWNDISQSRSLAADSPS